MKYTVIVVWMIDGDEIHSDVHTSSYREIAESFFKNYCILMKDPSLRIKSVLLYANGDMIERRINENGNQNRN